MRRGSGWCRGALARMGWISVVVYPQWDVYGPGKPMLSRAELDDDHHFRKGDDVVVISYPRITDAYVADVVGAEGVVTRGPIYPGHEMRQVELDAPWLTDPPTYFRIEELDYAL